MFRTRRFVMRQDIPPSQTQPTSPPPPPPPPPPPHPHTFVEVQTIIGTPTPGRRYQAPPPAATLSATPSGEQQRPQNRPRREQQYRPSV
ncbi:hypothetical protein LSAT2_006066 [Lamellibrachia satsuma]|nr:hypothetical protein LSAT2_006066 [Lamellibrachia satsuma]